MDAASIFRIISAQFCEWSNYVPEGLAPLMRMKLGETSESRSCDVEKQCDPAGNCRTIKGLQTRPLQADVLVDGTAVTTWNLSGTWSRCQ